MNMNTVGNINMQSNMNNQMSTGYSNINTNQNMVRGTGLPQVGTTVSIKNAGGGYISGCHRQGAQLFLTNMLTPA
jgi:hypothetical protein